MDTQTANEKRIVEAGGGDYVGRSCYGEGFTLVLFNSRETGSTLAINIDKQDLTPETVASKLNTSNAKFGVKTCVKPQPLTAA